VPPTADLDRLRGEYAARERRLAGSDRYCLSNPAHRFMIQQRQQAVLQLLREHCIALDGRRILEVGCGRGGVLAEWLEYGVAPRCLHGAELLPDRVCDAHRRLPQNPLTCADGQNLPYPAASFDLALQYTVFTSILDDAVKANLAREMLRVLRPDGLIIWYDFWLNPANRQTRGIRPAEIRRLFPGCRFDFRRLTLAPPLARAIVPASRTLALLLEKLIVFNSHYLVAIQRASQ
jgi:SAM-dependent methyltransferase